MSDKPAFPVDIDNTFAPGRIQSTGMTLHEWYAGMALQGLLAGNVEMHTRAAANAGMEIGAYFTKNAKLLADEMIKASQEREG